MTETQRTLYWRRLDALGGEYCCVRRAAASWLLIGTAVVVLDDEPFSASYRVACDTRWRTRDARLTVTSHGKVRLVRWAVDKGGQWRWDGTPVPQWSGCVDIDLGLTPATNTLPIRRLGLAVGESAEVTAAWVKFPELELAPLPQRYTRLAEDRYRYESFPHDYTTELVVDDWGIVREYAGGWVREVVVGAR